jgi:hypothetical protein
MLDREERRKLHRQNFLRTMKGNREWAEKEYPNCECSGDVKCARCSALESFDKMEMSPLWGGNGEWDEVSLGVIESIRGPHEEQIEAQKKQVMEHPCECSEGVQCMRCVILAALEDNLDDARKQIETARKQVGARKDHTKDCLGGQHAS